MKPVSFVSLVLTTLGLFVILEGPSFYFLRSCVCVDEATFGVDARAWPDRDSPP